MRFASVLQQAYTESFPDNIAYVWMTQFEHIMGSIT
jgi:hypothetical protein